MTDAASCPEAMVNPSPFRDLIGLRVAALAPGRAEVALEVAAPLMNYAGTLHGGVIASMIDMAGALSGCHSRDPARKRTAVTLMLATSFIGVAAGGTVRATGTRQGGGRQIFSAIIEVHDSTGKLIASGQGTYRYAAGSEEP